MSWGLPLRLHAWPAHGLERLLASGLALGGLTAWVCRHDARRPPLPGPALAAVSTAPRALARAGLRALVAFVSIVVLARAQGLWFADVTPDWAAIGAAAVGAAGLVEPELLRRDGASPSDLLAGMALTTLAALTGVLVGAAHITWWRGGWAGLDGVDWRIVPSTVCELALPLALVLATTFAARRAARGCHVVGVVAGLATPLAVLASVLLMGEQGELAAPDHELTAVILALPLAVRLGDAVGPGWRSSP